MILFPPIKGQKTEGNRVQDHILKSLPLATTWMELEGIMLSEISQVEKDKNQMSSLICGVYEQGKNWSNETVADTQNPRMDNSYQNGTDWGGREGREGEAEKRGHYN